MLTKSNAEKGGIIGLIRRGVEFRFEINRETIRLLRLKLGSDFLRLAETVSPKTSKEE